MANNYDPVARYYDFLSRLVFGQTEIDAQVGMLDCIRSGDRLLIVGGGTGWILDKLAMLYPEGLQITYVESSRVMMALARKRRCGSLRVSFEQRSIEQFVTDERFDHILTGFLFDNFRQEQAMRVVRSLDRLLIAGGYWQYADLYYQRKDGRWWHGLLLQSMYWAARLICRVEADKLPDMAVCFAAVGYEVVRRKSYYQGFIQAILYKKGI